MIKFEFMSSTWQQIVETEAVTSDLERSKTWHHMIQRLEGRTLDKVILPLRNIRSFMKFSHIFVAFSRVADHKDIRLLLPLETSHDMITYITALKQNPKILTFLKCIDANKKFDAEWIVKHVKHKTTARTVH